MRRQFSFEEAKMCKKQTTGPVKIGAILMSSAAVCVGCDVFEGCLEPQALVARVALELGARRALDEVALSQEAQRN